MTTLAYDGRYVAIDTQVTAGDIKFSERKHYEFADMDGRRLVAFGCGDVAAIQQAVNSLAGCETPCAGEYELLVVGLADVPVAYQGDGREPLRLSDGPYVAGSGAPAALAALTLGKNATQAVLTACKVDLYSGAPVETLNVRSRRWLKPRSR